MSSIDRTVGLCRRMSSNTPSWISASRAGSASRGLVRITPHSTSVSGFRPSLRTIPYPVTAVPGSMPRTSCGLDSRTRHLGDVHVEIRRDLLHVVEILELLEELHQRFGVLPFDVHRCFGDVGDFRFLDREAGALQ